jgi:hypothetical protein
MPKMIDITGQRFGQLIALKPVEQQDRKFYWLCRCDCGNTTIVQGKKLRNGHTQSCGHWRQDGSHRRTHGEAAVGHETREYITWKSMIDRCSRQNNKSFKYYGGRGIKVCERWHKFENFLADMGRRPPGHSIERVDNDGNYEPINCKWIPQSDQAKNTRKTRRRSP